MRATRTTVDPVDDVDVSLRNVTYAMFVESGRAPTATSVAEAIDATVEQVLQGWARLHDGHALVLQPGGDEIRMANPFSAVPTAHRVRAHGRWWYANCAWDAFGVCAALHTDGTIETSCPDCGDPIAIEVHDGRPDDPTLLFHCLVPASRWWDDIGFT